MTIGEIVRERERSDEYLRITFAASVTVLSLLLAGIAASVFLGLPLPAILQGFWLRAFVLAGAALVVAYTGYMLWGPLSSIDDDNSA